MAADDAHVGAENGVASLRRLLDLSIDLLAILDLQTRILDASASWERTFGWPVDQLVGSIFLELFHPEDLPRVLEELERLQRGEDAVHVVVRIRTQDGRYRWVQGNARSDLDAGRIYVTGADITERKALEDLLHHQVELEGMVAAGAARLIGTEPERVHDAIRGCLGQLAEALGADCAHFVRGSRLADERTAVTWCSAAMGAVDGPPLAVEAWWLDTLELGRALLVDDMDRLRSSAPDAADALAERGVRRVLVVPLPREGRFWGVVVLDALQEAPQLTEDIGSLVQVAGEGYLAALSQADAALALRDAQRELEARNHELEQSNEELERFAYAAAHDLKAPLARIEMALSSAEVRGEVAEGLLGIALRGATRMRQLIEDLLTFAAVGRGAGVAGPVDLAEVVDHVLVDLAPAAEACGAAVECGPLPVVRGHEAMLGQLLQNLIGNALKFTRDDGKPIVRISAVSDAAGVTVTVADNGIGIPVAERQSVFGVFVRLDSEDRFHGSGIGLATCAKVVHQHGGRIWVDDGIDGGAALSFWLPA